MLNYYNYHFYLLDFSFSPYDGLKLAEDLNIVISNQAYEVALEFTGRTISDRIAYISIPKYEKRDVYKNW